MIVVIDGPAGSGKSSTARAVADRLGIQYLDSGALYRALTLLYLESGKEEEAFFELLNRIPISFHYADGQFTVLLDGRNVTGNLRDNEVNDYVSEVASLPRSRKFVNERMRQAVRNDIWIAEGRDLGTAVFPDADLKFYMVADAETRARRRHRELREKGTDITLDKVKENIRKRDQKDANRESDPLKQAVDAVEIDTTELTFEQQVDFVCYKVTKLLETTEKS